MKVAVINYSGSVRKTLISSYLYLLGVVSENGK